MPNSSQDTTLITFFGLDNVNYPKHRGKLIEMYTHAFTEGRYAQYIAPDVLESTLDNIMRIGFGFMAFKKDMLVGAVHCLTLQNDPDFPFNSYPNIDPHKTLYIADIMVDKHFRGQGVARGLIEHLFKQSQPKPYEKAVIRVWNENIPALSLYKKLGFEEITTISQTKLRKETKEPFEMKKIYLYREL